MLLSPGRRGKLGNLEVPGCLARGPQGTAVRGSQEVSDAALELLRGVGAMGVEQREGRYGPKVGPRPLGCGVNRASREGKRGEGSKEIPS